MNEKALNGNNNRIVQLEEELEELRERQRALVREHYAEIHDQVGHILADHPNARARFHFRHDYRPFVEGTLLGNGSQACWIEPTGGEFEELLQSPNGEVRIDYISVNHVEPC